MLITEAYRAQQAALHATGNYGTTGRSYGPLVKALLASCQASSLLDYGCGSRRSLLESLEMPPDVVYEGYDPAVPAYADEPMPAELVVCIDVLEHIEPELLDGVLDHLASLCDPCGFFTIHTGPAQKVLSDGRNAHLTQQGESWWRPRLEQRFEVISLTPTANGFSVFVRSRQSTVPVPAGASAPMRLLKASGAQSAQGATSSPLAPNTATVEHKGRKMLFNTPNEMTVWRVKSLYTKEPDTIEWLEALPKGAVLLDVGANVGMYSIFAAAVRDAQVYAFEPESQNYALLNANIAANSLSEKITAFPAALSDEFQLGRLYLSNFSAGGSCHSFGEQVGFDLKPRQSHFTQGSVSVTLDYLVDSGAMPVPEFVKIDVDGFEHKVIAGARKTLANPKVRSVIVELNTHLVEHQQAIKLLEELGFEYDAAQAQGALRTGGAFEGVGEFIFWRKDPTGAHKVNFSKVFRFSLPSQSEGRRVLNHVLERVQQAALQTDPFPYSVVDNVFPDDYYRKMLAHFPNEESLRPIGETGRVTKDAYKERLTVLFTDDEFARMTPAQQAFWRDFASWMYSDQFLSAFIAKFHAHLEPRLANILSDKPTLELRGDALLVNDKTNYAIGPHTDAPHRLVTFLFYLPADASMRELGTSTYRHKDPAFKCWEGYHYPFDDFKRVSTIEFLPNRLFAFPKTGVTFHGVEPIKRANVNRPLLINNIRLLNKITH